MTEFFRQEKTNRIEWPSRSPDINIMENVWSIMVSKIYLNNQYYRKEELINAINKAANEIEEKMIILGCPVQSEHYIFEFFSAHMWLIQAPHK